MRNAIPQRILMTADTVGGVWCYALELAGALADSGVELVLATMGARPTSDQRRQAARVPNLRLAESSYRLEWMEDPWGDIEKAGEWLLNLEAEFAPAVIHLNGYVHAALPWQAPVLAVGHSCVLSWWRAVKKEDVPASWHAYATAVREGLQAASLVVAPTRAMLHSLQEHYGPLGKIKVIPNGRRTERIVPGQKEELVFSAGRLWDEAKNVSAVCAVAPDLSWPVCLAGDCTDPAGRVVEPPNVRCLGKLPEDQVLQWFGRAAIYALPAKYEPFGLSVLEAALGGCALVLGDIPSLRENWEGAALFVPPEDISALRAALQQLTRDAASRADLARRARERAAAFHIRSTAAQYLEAYGSLMNSNSRTRERCIAA